MQANTLAGLPNLTELTLTNVKLDSTELQPVLNRLTGLEKLVIEGCPSLQQVRLKNLTALKTLELSYVSDLVVNPSTVAGLAKLERLVISNPRSLDLSGLCTLTNLHVLILNGSRQPIQLPDCLGQLIQMTELRVNNGPITRLPAGIGSLKQVQSLNLMGCGIDSLPAGIGQLTALQELYLSNNKLRQLPELGLLKALRQLDVSGNQLTTLPESMGQLTQLTALNVERNKLIQLPAYAHPTDGPENPHSGR